MNDEYVDVEPKIGKDLADKIKKKTKKDLLNDVFNLLLELDVQKRNVVALEGIEQNLINQLEEGIVLRKRRVSELETKLDKAEAYVEQGRAMINAVMERWYEYDA